MNVDDFLGELLAIDGVVLHYGAHDTDIVALEKHYEIAWKTPPRAHRR